MERGQIWFKRRQDWNKSRFFSIKKNHELKFDVIMMAAGSLWENGSLGINELEGFEKKNSLLTDSEITKYILSGDLNPIIL